MRGFRMADNTFSSLPRRLSVLQRRILMLALSMRERHPEPLPLRVIEQSLVRSSNRPVYSPNLNNSCRRMEHTGLLRRLRAPDLTLAIELTDAGQAIAAMLLANERQSEKARRRAADCRVLPMRPATEELRDQRVEIDGKWHTACRGYFVIRLDGSTCLQLWRANGRRTHLAGDALAVAAWYQVCYDAGLPVGVQVNEGGSRDSSSEFLPALSEPMASE